MDPLAPEFRDGVRREARVLRAIARDDALRALRPWTPRHRADDPRAAVLVTDLVHPATTFQRFHENVGKPLVRAESGEVAGRILARVHAAPTSGALRRLPRDEPPIWGIPPALVRSAAHDAHAAWLLSALRDAPFRNDLSILRAEWTKRRALVHTDPRWENFLLTHGPGPRGAPLNVRLVDWELARLGDPAWDVAYYLTEHLRFCLVERLEWKRVHDAARAFWRAYAGSMRASKRRGLRARVVATLPHTLSVVAYEALSAAHARPEIPREAMRMALDVRPEEWFGLDEEG